MILLFQTQLLCLFSVYYILLLRGHPTDYNLCSKKILKILKTYSRSHKISTRIHFSFNDPKPQLIGTKLLRSPKYKIVAIIFLQTNRNRSTMKQIWYQHTKIYHTLLFRSFLFGPKISTRKLWLPRVFAFQNLYRLDRFLEESKSIGIISLSCKMMSISRAWLK